MDGVVLLAHGSGGRKTAELLESLFWKYFDDPALAEHSDGAVLDDLVFSTDSFVVQPLFFAGGDIGKLAVSGTANDVAVMGAEPLYLAAAFVIEEGFPLADLERIVRSMRETADGCGLRIVAGDTKVVEKGKGDGLYITTTGIGRRVFAQPLSPARIEPGDALLLSGSLGEHSLAVLTARGEYGLTAPLASDATPLWPLIRTFSACAVKFMRDPTRGGLAQILHEAAAGRSFALEVWEKEIPLERPVRTMCDILGFDPLYLANEGKVLVVVAETDAERLLARMRRHPLGKKAARIGRVTAAAKGQVVLRTVLGTERLLMPAAGELLPRIC